MVAFPKLFTLGPHSFFFLQCVCGFSTMDNIALLNLEGMGMAGHPGVAAKLFGALERVGISVILISQVLEYQQRQREPHRLDLDRCSAST